MKKTYGCVCRLPHWLPGGLYSVSPLPIFKRTHCSKPCEKKHAIKPSNKPRLCLQIALLVTSVSLVLTLLPCTLRKTTPRMKYNKTVVLFAVCPAGYEWDTTQCEPCAEDYFKDTPDVIPGTLCTNCATINASLTSNSARTACGEFSHFWVAHLCRVLKGTSS